GGRDVDRQQPEAQAGHDQQNLEDERRDDPGENPRPAPTRKSEITNTHVGTSSAKRTRPNCDSSPATGNAAASPAPHGNDKLEKLQPRRNAPAAYSGFSVPSVDDVTEQKESSA